MTSTFKLADHKYKKASIIIAGTGFLLAIAELLTEAIIFPALSFGFHLQICLFIGIMGLIKLAMCKEKEEDERVKAIRSKAMMQGFIFTCIMVLSFSINVSLFPFIAPDAFIGITSSKEDYPYIGMLLMAFPATSVISYLVLFNYGLRNDENWDYNDTMTPKENIIRNKKYLLIRTLISLAILAALIVWGRMSK
ncbi:MAG: hypothetical protein JNM41_07525 [Flavipsychrobacter sp.]|nr:hypothetical protein [Flavipsychrobacter sp.]